MVDFVVSDIHGCYLTFMKLLHRYYDKDTMRLVILGDYLDKGAFPYEMYRFLKRHLNQANCIFLRGNHEQEFIEHALKTEQSCWYLQDGQYVLDQLTKNQVDINEVKETFLSLPLFHETPAIFYSHAGVSIFKHNPLDPNDPCGLLWNRMTVANIGKLQIYGHTPHLNGPFFQSFSQSYLIDTGVFLSGYLSALIVDENGKVLQIHKEKTDSRDLRRKEKHK